MFPKEKFDLKTEIKSSVVWQTKTTDKNKKEREKFEKEVQEFIVFLNQDLSNVILQSIQQIHSEHQTES